MLTPAPSRLVRQPEPTPAKFSQAGIGHALAAGLRPMDRQAIVELDRNRASEAIKRQPFGEVARGLGLAIEQQVVAIVPDKEIEQAFALRGQQPGPDWERPGYVLRHHSLQESADILTGQADQGSITKGSSGHSP